MNRDHLLKAFKMFIIGLLVLMISVVVILNWKSDLIIDKVLNGMERRLTDSLSYSDASLNFFTHFPSIAVRIEGLNVGSGQYPLIADGNIELAMKLFPLLRGRVFINKLHITNTTLHLREENGRWTYQIIRPGESTTNDTMSSKIDEVIIEHTLLRYADAGGHRLDLDIEKGVLHGVLHPDSIQAEIQMTSTLKELKWDDYSISTPFASTINGNYTYHSKGESHFFKEMLLENDHVNLMLNGSMNTSDDTGMTDMRLQWNDVDPDYIKNYLPKDLQEDYRPYRFDGSLDGSAVIKGKTSGKHGPRTTAEIQFDNGNIELKDAGETLKNISVEVKYDSGLPDKKQAGHIEVSFRKKAMIGKPLEGKIIMDDPDQPVMDIALHGELPASLINLAGVDRLKFEKGVFHIDHFSLNDFRTTSTLAACIEKGKTSFTAEDVEFTYLHNKIVLNGSQVKWEEGKLDFESDVFKWNHATASALKGSMIARGDEVDFTLKGSLCEGDVETKGKLLMSSGRKTWSARWLVKNIEMKTLLESFDQFDQTFITSAHLNGKANIWAETVIPLDDKWNVITKSVIAKCALDIRDGRLKDMKTLEDFSDYIHLDDLKDIRFNQLRNYLKIENGKVYLPVMFIQSSAINLSISGEHSFNQDILYHVKLNAGQVAASKLKKQTYQKLLKPARKSGWINMYFVLFNTADHVQYKQDRVDVISGFEHSAGVKEALRSELVEKFGYDVYWIEPNEWEDIPEYE